MNREQANEIRASIGLSPLVVNAQAKKDMRRHAANKAAHAQACRDLKAKRSNGRKG